MNGSRNAADIRTGLVIGIHQKELGFGRQVAAILPAKNIRIVQIDQALPQQDSFKGKRFYYSVFHREIYLQQKGQRADWIYGAGLVESIIKAKAWRRSS
ncbi:MAG: hypothetical protein R6V60_02795 [Desulfobacterales bacterium]